MRCHPLTASGQEFNICIIFKISSSVYILTTVQYFMPASIIFLLVAFCGRLNKIQERWPLLPPLNNNTPAHPTPGRAALFIRGTFYFSNTCHHSQANNSASTSHPCAHTSFLAVIQRSTCACSRTHTLTHAHTHSNANVFTGVWTCMVVWWGWQLHLVAYYECITYVSTDGQLG